MLKKIIYFLILVTVVFSLYKLLSQKPDNFDYSDSDFTFYWGNNCPHCENVKNYFQTNKIDQKFKINSKEVYFDQENQKDLFDKVVQYCPEIDPENIGVPLLFDFSSQKCILGDQPIIDFLSQKAQ